MCCIVCNILALYGAMVCLLWVIVVGVLYSFNSLLGTVTFALVILYYIFQVVSALLAVEVHSADNAALTMYAKGRLRGSNNPDMPDKLKGVFWMSDNAAPEMLVTFEGENFYAEKRSINLSSGGTYNWTVHTGMLGWGYWLCLRCSYMHCAELHVNFRDEEYTVADMPLYVYGCCQDHTSCCDGIWMPMGQWWTLEQVDENTWNRNIYLYCWPCSRWSFGSYLLRRIIDHNGTKLPAFDEMMDSIERGDKVKGVLKKPLMQSMNGDDYKGYLCYGQAGNPDLEALNSSEAEGSNSCE